MFFTFYTFSLNAKNKKLHFRETSPLLNKISESSQIVPKQVSRKFLKKSEDNVVRNPYLINADQVGAADGGEMNNVAQYNRYRYYSKLHNNPGDPLVCYS